MAKLGERDPGVVRVGKEESDSCRETEAIADTVSCILGDCV